MADNLTEEESTLVEAFLQRLNGIQTDYPVDCNTAVKFLMARKFDVKRAIDLYLAHQKTRQREDLKLIEPTNHELQNELATEKLTVLSSRDISGAAIALFTARAHLPSITSHQLVLKALIYQLDAALESLETQRNGLVFIYDMTDSKIGNFDYDLSSKILNMLTGAYPARLKKVLIVTAPLWFKAPFKILRPFVREKLRDRVYTVNKTQLPIHIPKDSLPEQLGGSLKVCHKTWLSICYLVATNQNPEMDSYFITRGNKNSQYRNASISSLSSDTDTNMLASDFESECSHETVNEKHIDEDQEKEGKDDIDSDKEKEVAVEKEDNNLNKVRDSHKKISSDSRKRSSDCTLIHSNCPGDLPPPPLPCKKRPLSPSSEINNECVPEILDEVCVHGPEAGGMTVQDLLQHIKRLGKHGLFQEYTSVRMEPPAGTFTHSRSRHNVVKNRYTDVLCLDHTRIVLPCIDGDSTTDYINANFMDGYKHKNAYISTQGPLPKTFADFWRMIWEQKSQVIVMTTKAVERGRTKCGQYWPYEEDTGDQYEEFVLHNQGIQQYKDFIMTSLRMLNTKTDESREITHLQFTSWPDYGIPHSAEAFLEFLFKIRDCQAEGTKRLASSWKGHVNGPPIVVHCSAGIGRTGTIITVDITLRRLHDIGTVDLKKTVQRIRCQRAFSIQMPDQYVFCHLAVIEHAQKLGLLLDDINLSGFDESESESD